MARLLGRLSDIRVDDSVSVHGIVNVTALAVAVDNSDEEMVKLILAHGADPNWQYDLGIPVVICASARGRPRILRALLDARADPSACKLDEGKDALDVAEMYGQRACARALRIEMAKKARSFSRWIRVLKRLIVTQRITLIFCERC